MAYSLGCFVVVVNDVPHYSPYVYWSVHDGHAGGTVAYHKVWRPTAEESFFEAKCLAERRLIGHVKSRLELATGTKLRAAVTTPNMPSGRKPAVGGGRLRRQKSAGEQGRLKRPTMLTGG